MKDHDFSVFANEDRPKIREFFGLLNANGRTEGTLTSYYYSLRGLAECLDGPLSGATKRERVEAVGEYGEKLAESTLKDRLAKVKCFYKWMTEGDGYPEVVDWVNTTSNASKNLPDKLLSRKEIRRMIDCCDHPHDRAMIAALYESGLRASEFLSLNVESIEFGRNMARAILPKHAQRLKTGQRRIPLVTSAPYLQEWINQHPGDGDDPLWICLGWNRRHQRLSYGGFRNKVKRIAGEAGIEKEVYPHLFRHSRATELAKKGFSEAEMRIILGWAKGSDMPSKYIHLAARAVQRGRGKCSEGVPRGCKRGVCSGTVDGRGSLGSALHSLQVGRTPPDPRGGGRGQPCWPVRNQARLPLPRAGAGHPPAPRRSSQVRGQVRGRAGSLGGNRGEGRGDNPEGPGREADRREKPGERGRGLDLHSGFGMRRKEDAGRGGRSRGRH
ncbi:hypothetical protein AKJ57_00730 [candidate division MSBL1 archaeon SCGC-AAA259A05]|uniref:Tyr recombinase domain-containing protein n=1 Tax=candidate division MSBL1 archaeon SCGC-AAA259A05 TaxID=1698259 RepID=A0A133UBL3_9EURY|nr:hypothetical protein AKJ57_00730 [candidate division MSBL1 archaeon SCGC-AAA259A05]